MNFQSFKDALVCGTKKSAETSLQKRSQELAQKKQKELEELAQKKQKEFEELSFVAGAVFNFSLRKDHDQQWKILYVLKNGIFHTVEYHYDREGARWCADDTDSTEFSSRKCYVELRDTKSPLEFFKDLCLDHQKKLKGMVVWEMQETDFHLSCYGEEKHNDHPTVGVGEDYPDQCDYRNLRYEWMNVPPQKLFEHVVSLQKTFKFCDPDSYRDEAVENANKILKS